jgi:hydroxypyruvate isomerase
MNSAPTTRRKALAGLGLAAASASLAQRLSAAEAAADRATKGRIHHSVCKWCYKDVSLEDLARFGKSIGLRSIELLSGDPAKIGPEMELMRKYDLSCAITMNPSRDGLGGIPKAWNRVEHHDTLVAAYEEFIPAAAAAGVPSVICFSGNRDGMDDETGAKNCITGLKRIMATAEKHKITLIMELLNSKVNHKDYMCDRTPWGAAVVDGVGSERFKLLYDIYHMQIMEGDVIATLNKYKNHIGHYHTGGVPGRAEIDESQELYYPAIMRAIVDTGYQGFVGQEFIPKRPDKLASLRQAVVDICDV